MAENLSSLIDFGVSLSIESVTRLIEYMEKSILELT
jgi:hypothetical protein